MALSCSLNKNLLKESNCGYSLQSVSEIYLAKASDAVVSEAAVGEGCGKEISGITLASTEKWYKIEPNKNSASFTDVLNVSDNGLKWRTHTLSFSLGGKYDGEMACVIDGLVFGNYLVVAVMANGDAILLGSPTAGLEATVVTNTGAASASDASGITVEMSTDIDKTALPLNAEALTAVKESASSAE